MSETRNELLGLLSYVKNTDNKDFYLQMLLERFYYDLKRKQEDLESELAEVKSDMEVLEYVKKELNIK